MGDLTGYFGKARLFFVGQEREQTHQRVSLDDLLTNFGIIKCQL